MPHPISLGIRLGSPAGGLHPCPLLAGVRWEPIRSKCATIIGSLAHPSGTPGGRGCRGPGTGGGWGHTTPHRWTSACMAGEGGLGGSREVMHPGDVHLPPSPSRGPSSHLCHLLGRGLGHRLLRSLRRPLRGSLSGRGENTESHHGASVGCLRSFGEEAWNPTQRMGGRAPGELKKGQQILPPPKLPPSIGFPDFQSDSARPARNHDPLSLGLPLAIPCTAAWAAAGAGCARALPAALIHAHVPLPDEGVRSKP